VVESREEGRRREGGGKNQHRVARDDERQRDFTST